MKHIPKISELLWVVSKPEQASHASPQAASGGFSGVRETPLLGHVGRRPLMRHLHTAEWGDVPYSIIGMWGKMYNKNIFLAI